MTFLLTLLAVIVGIAVIVICAFVCIGIGVMLVVNYLCGGFWKDLTHSKRR